MDVESRNKLDDIILRTKFSSLRWTTDNRGIFYTTYADVVDNNSTTSTENKKKTEEENAVKIFLCSKFFDLHYFSSRRQMK